MRTMALLARLLWEAVLLIGVVAVITLTVVEPSGRELLANQAVAPVSQLCAVGLLALGLSLSVRVGAPNLAVGSLASVGSVALGRLCTTVGMPLPLAFVLVVAGAVAAGLLITVAVAVLRVPSWAASLALAALLSTLARAVNSADVVPVDGPGPDHWALPLAVLLGLGSIGVGMAMWTDTGPVVAGLARRAGDPGPAGARSVQGVLLLVGATTLSSVLAAAAGMVEVLSYRAVTAPSTFGAEFLAWALVPVLIAGTSLRSPRGVVTGIALASALEIYGQLMFTVHDAPTWASPALMAALALVGLLVGRGLDAVAERMTGGRPGTGTSGIARDAAGAW
jgi:ribose/xylose/arabinose/galactoside ABC-type transport system permease subunit